MGTILGTKKRKKPPALLRGAFHSIGDLGWFSGSLSPLQSDSGRIPLAHRTLSQYPCDRRGVWLPH